MLRKAVAGVFIAVYLLLIGWHFTRHVVGDPGSSPFRYFWTWDMYPSYDTEIARPVAVGFDAQGRAWQLVPGPGDQFLWGNHADAHRTDLDRREATLRRAVAAEVDRLAHTSPPLQLKSVAVFENYRPLTLESTSLSANDEMSNEEDSVERSESHEEIPATTSESSSSTSDANSPKSWRGHRSYWRKTSEAVVTDGGELEWKRP